MFKHSSMQMHTTAIIKTVHCAYSTQLPPVNPEHAASLHFPHKTFAVFLF